MDKVDRRLELYKIASDNWRHEGTMRWLIFSAFLTIHSAILAYLLKYIYIDSNESYSTNFIIISCMSGILLTVVWHLLFVRINTWFKYRILRAKELELKNWELVGGRAYRLTKGTPVRVAGKVIKPYWCLKIKNLVGFISRFTVIQYTLLLLIPIYILLMFSGCHNTKHQNHYQISSSSLNGKIPTYMIINTKTGEFCHWTGFDESAGSFWELFNKKFKNNVDKNTDSTSYNGLKQIKLPKNLKWNSDIEEIQRTLGTSFTDKNTYYYPIQIGNISDSFPVVGQIINRDSLSKVKINAIKGMELNWISLVSYKNSYISFNLTYEIDSVVDSTYILEYLLRKLTDKYGSFYDSSLTSWSVSYKWYADDESSLEFYHSPIFDISIQYRSPYFKEIRDSIINIYNNAPFDL